MKKCDYWHGIEPGMIHHVGHFYEKEEKYSSKKQIGFELSKKCTYFYKENILYPFVNIQEGKKGHFLTNQDYVDTLIYIERNGFNHLQ